MEDNVSHHLQHENHVHKEMHISTTAYLPLKYDITSSGMAFKMSMERVGQMLAAKTVIKVFTEMTKHYSHTLFFKKS